MNPAQQLQEQGYSLDTALHHNELIPFVVTNLFRKNLVTISFLVCNIVFIAAWLIVCGYYLWNDALSFNGLLKWSGIGAFLILPLVPVHEVLHGLLTGCRERNKYPIRPTGGNYISWPSPTCSSRREKHFTSSD